MITIYDIAKRAKVSAATVSKVLNGYPDVSQKTREKVQKITAELGFQPSSVARGLATKRSWTIGIFFQDHVNSGFQHPFLQDVLKGFKDVMGGEGYDLLFFADHTVEKGLEGFEPRARRRNVDGILLLGVPRTAPALEGLATSSIPCMSIDLDFLGSRAGYLCSDNIGGAKKAVNYLVERGHTQIGFIGDRFHTKPGHDRLLGFQESLKEQGISFRPEWVKFGDFTEPSGYETTKELLQLSEIPSAIFYAGDMMAIRGMQAIRDQGLEVGKDISVIGFDDIALARYMQLTTIGQRKALMGQQTAQALLKLIEDPHLSPPVLTVETDLVVRQTVGNIS